MLKRTIVPSRESPDGFVALNHLPRLLFALVLASGTLLRAASGFPEFKGFFAESAPGVYRAHGAQLAVEAGAAGVYFNGRLLEHCGGAMPLPTPVEPTGALVNSYSGRQASEAKRAYRVIEYRGIYPGVTLRLSFDGRAVKADYLVAAGVDPDVIRFRYSDLKPELRDGELVAGEIRQPAPVVYQGSTKLSASYRIDGEGWVRFVIGPHDPAQPIVIDPYVINASGYLGGALTDFIAAMAIDGSGYMYIAGSTESTDFPAGSIVSRNAGVEAFVMKINPATLQVVYATYLGGNAEDRALAIAVDSTGSAYFSGYTGSTDFPGLPVYGGGARDGFVARLNASGALQFTTFLGGSGSDSANAIALKADGSAWVAGETTSTDFPLYGVPYQALNRGSQDVFLARVNAGGSIAYTTYFGGTGDDRAVGLALDASGEVYFTGGTTSTNFPVANAFRGFNSGLQDAFVAKISSDGAALRYSTYLGGSAGSSGQNEVGNWVGVDSTGAAYVVGITGSSNFPVTGTAIQSTYGGGVTDAFIAKISAVGTSLLYSTYYGGSSTDEGWLGAIAPDGTFYFGGNTSSPELLGIDAIQSAAGGDLDGFFGKLTGDLGTRLTFSYLGYTGQDTLTGLAVTSSNVYLAGSSASPAWLPSGGFKGWYDGWVMKLTENPLTIAINSSVSAPLTISGSGCSPASITAPGNVSWKNGASCTVSFTSPQGAGPTRYAFQGWADGGALNPRTIVASSFTPSYTMQWVTKHQLTRSVSPAGAGTINGTDGYYTSGSSMQLTATANAGYQFSGWSGSASGSTNPLTLLIDGPKTVTANFNALVTFNSTPAVQITTSGTGCAAGTYTTPITLAWTAGATCTVSFSGTQVSGDTRWVFSKWADGPTTNPRSIVATAGTAYSLQWNTEYRLTRTITPAGAGSISGSDGFYAAGAAMNLSATASTGYQFSSWSGDASGSANPLSFTMTGPKNITANFSVRTTQVTIDSTVSSLQFTVTGTGCNPATYYTPQTFTWAEGAICSISTPATQGGDVRWVFNGWTDNSTANPRTVTASTPSTYVMRFDTQYKLTRSVSGQGSVNGTDGFFAAGSSIQLTATPSPGNQFTGWSGNIVTSANPVTFTLNSPATITANFSASPISVSIGSNVAAQFSVSGAGCPVGTYTAPTSVIWTNGTTCTFTAPSPQGGPDTRWVSAGWSDTTANPRNLVASAGASYTLSFTAEHKVTRTLTGQGSVSGTDAFYAAGSSVQFTATAAAGYQFTGWSGAASGTTNPIFVAVDGPKTLTANFAAMPVAVRIDSAIAAQFSVSGAGCPVGSYTAPIDITWTSGTGCNVTITTPQGGSDTRWIFSKWADGPTSNPRTLIASSGAAYTLNWSTEHRLTRTANGPGTIGGADGFYPAGSAIQLSATPSAGYQFTGWSGSATGTANPLTIAMDAPKSVTASFAAAPVGVRIDSPTALTFTVSGTGCPAGAYSAPTTLNWTNGTACSINVLAPAATVDTRMTFSKWSDGVVSNPRTITAASGAVYTVVLNTEYKLTRTVQGQGSISGIDGFYPAGTALQLTATAAAGYQFTGWSGSATGSANPLSISMSSPKTVTATFAVATANVVIDSNTAAQFTLSGAGCPAGTYTAPIALSWTFNLSCAVSVSTQGNADTRLVFLRWSDGSTSNPRNLTASPGATFQLVMETQHRLTRSVTGSGSVSGSDGFYAAGSDVQLTATPASGYLFSGWSGAASGSANPITVRMNGPATVTANFSEIPIPGVGVDAFEPLTGSGPTGTFTATFSHGGGANQHYLGYILLLPTPNIVQYTAKGSCLIEYNRISNGMRLINDAGDDWLGPISGVVLGPTAGSLTNAQCTVNLSGASGRVNGTVMTVSVPVTFRNGITPVVGTFLQAFDVKGKYTGMTQFGNWTPAGGTPKPGVSITANASTTAGSSAVYTITTTHTSGAGLIGMVTMLISSAIIGGTPCQAFYFPGGNILNLVNEAGTAMVSPAGIAAGTPGMLANSRCSINTGQATRAIAGNNVTVSIPMSFQPAAFGGFKRVYVNAFDGFGELTHWVQTATMNVQ